MSRRPARRAQGLVGSHAPSPDQRDAASLRASRSPTSAAHSAISPQRRRADAAGDREAEVHEGARALGQGLGRRGRRRARGAFRGRSDCSPLRLLRLALHVLAGYGCSRSSGSESHSGHLHDPRDRARRLRDLVLDRPARTSRDRCSAASPSSSCSGSRLHSRPRRGVLGQNPARGRRAASTADLGGTVSKRVLVTGDCSFIVELHPPPAGVHRPRGRLARRPHLRGEPGEPRRRDRHRRLSARPRRHPRPRVGREEARRRVDVIVNAAAESHVEKSIRGGGVGVRDDERRGDADPARRDLAHAGRALRPDLLERGVRDGGARPDGREHPLNPRSPYAATKAGGDRLAYSYYVTYGLPIVIVRPFNNYGPRQHPEKVIPALHHAGALG